ncbi:putative lumazine-binding protein [Nitzschia inconspicua]|uniref:Lumazine-binding protein n=1 Tax=Nitzschia inconspicua TaxID=303405 RepID=A0A9K3PP77_9STRA|nr:putative lumazine-binding protein [Nitzschia inconspicua]
MNTFCRMASKLTARRFAHAPRPSITAAPTFAICRTHMNHGGGSTLHAAPPTQSGPRSPNVELGFAATKHTGNILRLLESSHGAYFYNTYDALSTVWHASGQIWRSNDRSNVDGWTCVNSIEALMNHDHTTAHSHHHHHNHHHHHHHHTPRLCSISFSDDRTAMVKMAGQDGKTRYLQLVRLDGDLRSMTALGGGMTPNDGWILVQEVEVVAIEEEDQHMSSSAWTNLHSTLVTYLNIEHGGGEQSYQQAKSLFHQDAKLISVGIDDVDATPTQWTAPVGSLVEIPLEAYLDGVQSQTPHSESAKSQDAIVSIDYTTGTNAAAATVRVGNGAQTLVFEDHLLLGRTGDEWRILSKTFSSQPWTS